VIRPKSARPAIAKVVLIGHRAGERTNMLNWIIRNRLAAFERKYDYDMSAAREILAADRSAFFAFAKVTGVGKYRKDLPAAMYWATKIVATVSEDCGSCTQMTVAMALEDGVEARVLSAVLANDEAAMSDEARLGVRFARASLARAPETDELREEIARRHGPRAIVSLAFALCSARFFPTLKYALGYGNTCQRVFVAGQPVAVAHA
jgi:hypothetical protein